MNRHPLVSVVTPTYQSAPYLAKLCESLQSQSCGDFEVLLGDDASTDETQEVLEPFLADPRFRLLAWKSNRGVGKATTLLLSEARGEFWCHPGSDDALKPDFIARRTALLQANPQAVLAHGPATHIDPHDRVIEEPAACWNFKEGAHGPSLPQLLQHNTLNTPGIMGRMSAVHQVLPFFSASWRYAFDWHMWLLLAALGGDIVWDPVPCHFYRIHPTSLTTRPEGAACRAAETRLIPLYSLALAARFSSQAALLWARYRRPLYNLWLMRAATLSRRGCLKDEWLQLAAQAFYTTGRGNITLAVELARYAPWILADFAAERRAVRQQTFRVSGLALVNDPLFRKKQ